MKAIMSVIEQQHPSSEVPPWPSLKFPSELTLFIFPGRLWAVGGSVWLTDQSDWACSAALWLQEAELEQHRLVVLLWNRRSTKLGCVCLHVCFCLCVCVFQIQCGLRVLPQWESKVKQPQESILVGYTAAYIEETHSYHTYGMYLGRISPSCELFCNCVCVKVLPVWLTPVESLWRLCQSRAVKVLLWGRLRFFCRHLIAAMHVVFAR